MVDERRSEEAVELEMLEVLGKKDERLEGESGYFEERRVGYDEGDVDDDADCDEEGGEGFEFVVGGK